MDLAAEWRSRRWRKLLNIIDQLPRTSQFVQAISDDEEYAELLALQPPSRSGGPRMSEYSPEREALDMVVDRLGTVVTAIAASAGDKSPPKFKPVKRPRTALDRVQARLAQQKHKSIVSRMLPNK